MLTTKVSHLEFLSGLNDSKDRSGCTSESEYAIRCPNKWGNFKIVWSSVFCARCFKNVLFLL